MSHGRIGRRSRGRRRGGIVGINVTPMVDVMLVLLVIMMVSATYIVSRALKVELPKSADVGRVGAGADHGDAHEGQPDFVNQEPVASDAELIARFAEGAQRRRASRASSSAPTRTRSTGASCTSSTSPSSRASPSSPSTWQAE